MNRRNFLHTLIGGVSASAAVRTWPFRVYSFPSQFTFPRLSSDQAQKAYDVLTKAVPIQISEEGAALIKHWLQYDMMKEPFDYRYYLRHARPFRPSYDFRSLS